MAFGKGKGKPFGKGKDGKKPFGKSMRKGC